MKKTNENSYNPILFDYPCVNPLSSYLKNKSIWVFYDSDINSIYIEKIKEKDGDLYLLDKHNYKSAKGSPDIAIIFPPDINYNNDDITSYYAILNYYIERIQIILTKTADNRKMLHLLIAFPYNSCEFSTKLASMAYYSISGLVKGLAHTYTNKGLHVCGIVLEKDEKRNVYSEWINYIISNNANNLVGEIIQL